MNNKSIQYKKKISRPNRCIAGEQGKSSLFTSIQYQLLLLKGEKRSTSKEMQKAFGHDLMRPKLIN